MMIRADRRKDKVMKDKKKEGGKHKNARSTEPMINMIAKIAAETVYDTQFFGWNAGSVVLYCDLLLKLCRNEMYQEAVEFIDFIFYAMNQKDAGRVVSVAASGQYEQNFRDFLKRYFELIDIECTFEAMKSIVANENF